MSKQEFSALNESFDKKNDNLIINDSDKNLGAAAAEKEDAIRECNRQLYNINTYINLSRQKVEILIVKMQSEL